MNLDTEDAEFALTHFLQLNAQQRHEEAWEFLNRSVEKFPKNAQFRFLLGSFLAGRQQYIQAQSQMEYAVQLEPGFEIARFQLGSLRFTGGDAAGAKLAWEPLADLPDSHPLKLFKNGCEALMGDRFEETVQWLQRGIVANKDIEYLNHDMQLLLDKTLELIRGNQFERTGGDATHLLISGYQNNSAEVHAEDMTMNNRKHTTH